MNPRPVVLMMGVSGSGKTTVGRLLASQLGVRFVDGDDLHPPANVAKMSDGTPLDDDDRWPWLDLVRAEIARALAGSEGLVVACSALKSAYRARLVKRGEPVSVVFLSGPPELIARRMTDRKGHFMPPGLLASQFAALEVPDGAIVAPIDPSPEAIVAQIVAVAGFSPAPG